MRIYQHVQIAARGAGDQELVDKQERRHAKIGNNIVLGCACIVLAPITIVDNSVIGASAIVTHAVPPDSVVTGINQIRPQLADMTFRHYPTNPLAKQ